ncbi:MAG: BrnT family toxin [Candidatus Accumulibacter necessarius]
MEAQSTGGRGAVTFFAFDWDANKARTNLAKHGISFRLATSVFRDPLALTIFDEERSDDEDRWVTLGQAQNGQVLVVVHTSDDVRSTELHIRIISARRADPAEVLNYEQTPR